MAEWHAVLTPPRDHEWCWRWGINSRPPRDSHEAKSAIGFGMKWGYALTKRGAERKASFWMRRYAKRNRDRGESIVFSLDDIGLGEEVERTERKLNKMREELERRESAQG